MAKTPAIGSGYRFGTVAYREGGLDKVQATHPVGVELILSEDAIVTLTHTAQSAAVYAGDVDRPNADDVLFQVRALWAGTIVGVLDFLAGSDTTNKDEGRLRVRLAAAGGTLTERLKIDENGVLTLNGGPQIHTGTGTPESAVAAPVGSTFHRTDGGAGTSFYVKESGTGTTGWVAK